MTLPCVSAVAVRRPSGSCSSTGPFVLTNAGRPVDIPVVGGETPHVEVLALKDGAGIERVTVGVRSRGAVWFSGILRPGTTEVAPIEVK